MIIGHGDIASVIKDREDRVYFASGISNSQKVGMSEKLREQTLLLKQNRSKRLVYFSSLCIFYSDTNYAVHKRLMEDLVKKNFENYTIIRMGNITWGINPHTLINSIRNKIKNRESFEIQDVYRFIVDKDEFLYWMDMIPEWNCEMNIIGKRMLVKDIVREYCYPFSNLKFKETRQICGESVDYYSI